MKKDIYDVLFWSLLAFALIFIILRIVGVINSPDWIDLIPLATIIFAAGVAYQKLVGIIEKVYGRTGYLKNKFDILESKVDTNEKRIIALEKGHASLKSGQETILRLVRKK